MSLRIIVIKFTKILKNIYFNVKMIIQDLWRNFKIAEKKGFALVESDGA